LDTDSRIVISGGAGLVGQNLVVTLREAGYRNLLVLDKSRANLDVMRRLQPGIETVETDLSVAGDWQSRVAAADALVILHAQIGGLLEQEFQDNNVNATRNLLESLRDNPGCYLLHVSSSVVNSSAEDFYTRSKLEQEQMVEAAPQDSFILRPTLMFGWFDRKHLGWLSRFMRRFPVFPVPGRGDYLRQPLYAGDFCRVLQACLEQRPVNGSCNVSGKEKVTYIDIIRKIRRVTGAKALILPLPRAVFALLLRVYALFDRNPPFTVSQLRALVIDELFEDVDWESRFHVKATPLDEALAQTFGDARYSDVVLEF
jgi:nucleoside-diphosphate-sugar epimerase